MDLQETIRLLKKEKERIESAISTLEEYLKVGGDPTKPVKRRGRTSMPPEERKEVAKRMKKYWADRRRRPPE